MTDELFIGLDFGSDSVRALLVSSDGEHLKSAVHNYSRWSKGLYSDAAAAQFRQHPLDYLEGLEKVIPAVICGYDPLRVRGIGIATTGSTPCAVDSSGVPLALNAQFGDNPNAMFLLWKDHTAVLEAEEITLRAKQTTVDYTCYEGGCYSAEWFWAKYLHVLRADKKVRHACHSFVEHCDWIAAELAGAPVKAGRCAAGHKAMWHQSWGGLPPEEFWAGVDPLLAGRRAALYDETYTADVAVGNLSAKWAKKLGLHTGVVIAGGALDCHMGAVGAGVKPHQLVMVIGTSACEILVIPKTYKCISGICGQVDGSVIPGMTGLEAGQAAFGDIYAWFRQFLTYAGPVDLSRLEAEAAALAVSDVLALDWHNGRRSPNANQKLAGALSGLNLGTTAPMMYRALVEGTAFGAKRIIDHFNAQGICVREVAAVGGIARKSPFVMQICADVMNMPIRIAQTDQACALGAAMFAAVASGVSPDIETAMRKMNSGFETVYRPIRDNVQCYRRQYDRYLGFAAAVEAETMNQYK